MNFKEWLYYEVFNLPLPIKWNKRRKTDWEGTFTIQDAASNPDPAQPVRNRRALSRGKQYIIRMIKIEDMPWEVIFELVIGDNKRSQDITGTGNAAQVFSTVLSGIQQWLDSVKPDAFVLSAREPSRHKLYSKIGRMLPSNIWDIEDLGTTFFVKNRKEYNAQYSGYSDNDFDDYYDDDE